MSGAYLNIIDKIYDAALDEALWADLSKIISAHCASESVNIQVRDANRGTCELLSLTDNYDEWAIDRIPTGRLLAFQVNDEG